MLGSSGSFSCAGVSRDTRRNRPNLSMLALRLFGKFAERLFVSETLCVWLPHFSTLCFGSCPRALASFERYPPPPLLRRTSRCACVRAVPHACRMLVEYSLL